MVGCCPAEDRCNPHTTPRQAVVQTLQHGLASPRRFGLRQRQLSAPFRRLGQRDRRGAVRCGPQHRRRPSRAAASRRLAWAKPGQAALLPGLSRAPREERHSLCGAPNNTDGCPVDVPMCGGPPGARVTWATAKGPLHMLPQTLSQSLEFRAPYIKGGQRVAGAGVVTFDPVSLFVHAHGKRLAGLRARAKPRTLYPRATPHPSVQPIPFIVVA